MYADALVLLIVVVYPSCKAMPPFPPALPVKVPPTPPIPMMNPLLTTVMVSPDVPPDKVKPGVPVPVE
jgi:hypothetical protein